jgi:hypothetical protein
MVHCAVVSSVYTAMPPTEEDIAWFKSTFHPIPKAELPDDCVEYTLHLISANLGAANDSEVRDRLREVQKYASELQKTWTKDYIWQRQGFALELNKENGEVCTPLRRTIENNLTMDPGSSLLSGRTEYGDSVEDEWVVVWLLRELTKKFDDLWVKITDSDGEFLLIEASGTLPAWLEPDVAENRVWIHNGGLVIIRPETAAKSKRVTKKLTLAQARSIVLEKPTRLLKSASIQEEAFYRLRNYPAQIKENTHHALARIPRKIAFLLRQKPAYIAPAVEAFYLRDSIALKPLQTRGSPEQLIFPPTDLVTVSVKVPRVAYAQLKSQEFPVPAVWEGKMPSKLDAGDHAIADTGMKVACGFEMLVSDPHNQDKAAVREMKMLLDDLETGDELLPTDEEIKSWNQTQDDDKWLDISFGDLEGELAGKSRGASSGSKAKGAFGDVGAQENLQRIVKQFEDFLNDDKAGLDGAGMFYDDSNTEDIDDDSDDETSESGEDREASFDEDDFTKMMREMMGMPSEVLKEVMAGKDLSRKTEPHDATAAPKSGHVAEVGKSESEPSDDEEMKEIMHQMEAELREGGALNLDPSTRKVGPAGKAIDGGGGKAKQKRPTAEDVVEDDDSSDDGSENDTDINLARNLLESLKSQAGMSGPGSNLMGMMGMAMPRDEGEAEASGRLQNKRK